MRTQEHRWARHVAGAVVLVAQMLASVQAMAAGPPASHDPNDRTRVVDIDEEVWKEGEARFPAPPDQANLITFTSLSFDAPYEYFIDKESVAMAADGIFRYTAVVRSDTGVVNVLYEGIRCESKEYKTYAYLSGEEFHPTSAPQWQTITRSGGTEYRAALYEELVCVDPKAPTPMSKILSLLLERDENSKRTVPFFKRSSVGEIRD